MKTLNTIQKTIGIFGIFTKIAYVFSIIGAACCAVGAICAVAGYSGGQLFTLFGKPVILFSGDKSLNEILAVLLTDDGRKKFLKAWQERKRDTLTHPYLNEKMSWGLVPYVQALLLARYLRGDLDAYPPFLWK